MTPLERGESGDGVLLGGGRLDSSKLVVKGEGKKSHSLTGSENKKQKENA